MIEYEIELQRRKQEAEQGYMRLKELCKLFGISKEEYVRRFLQTMPAIIWNSSTTGGTTNDSVRSQ